MLNIDPVVLERFVVGGVLAAIAVAVAFGPELSRALVRVRSRSIPVERDAALGAERATS